MKELCWEASAASQPGKIQGRCVKDTVRVKKETHSLVYQKVNLMRFDNRIEHQKKKIDDNDFLGI